MTATFEFTINGGAIVKNSSLISIITLLLLCGCATIQATRKAQYLSDNYDGQVQKDIFVVSLIDARTDKKKDLQELLANKVTITDCILNPLQRKGYVPKFLRVDTSACGSLTGINNISEMACLDNKLFENGNLFLLVSIDQYSSPKGMGINGNTKVTGVIYSKNLNTFIWKDCVEGNYDVVNTMMFGLGGYTAKMMMKSMTPDLTFRSNALGSMKELLNSVPPFPDKNNK